MAVHTHVQYRDLDLKIHEDAYGDCWVEAIGAPGSRSEPVRLVMDDPRIDEWVELFKERQAPIETCEALGRALFRALFSGQIANVWERMRLTLGPRTALRMRLDIRHTRLANLPWELMIPTLGEDFALVLSPNRPITRCIYNLTPATDVEPPQPLQMLVVVSEPQDAPPFASEKILATLDDTLAPHEKAGRIQVTIEQHMTATRLADQLTSDYDIVHYIGHGTFDHGSGSLVLETSGGRADPMDGRVFGSLLVGAKTRLLVIEACGLASSSPLDPRLGVADAALHAGVPAVVAMQGSITDDEAALFSRAFYTALIDGEPLESCVAYGRRHILTVVGRGRPGWAAPVLYSNLPDGLLYDSMPQMLRASKPAGVPVASPGRGLRPLVESLPPPWYGQFRHRDAEVTRILQAIAADESERLVLIEGPAGSGTSSLALEVARRCLERSRKAPDMPGTYAGAIWVSGRRPPLEGPLPIQRSMGWTDGDFYRRLAEALPATGLWEAHPDERWDLMRAALRQHRYLVVVDDFDELRGLSVKELADRLPAPTTVVVTSHVPLQADAFTVGVDAFSAGQAVDLVRKAARAGGATGPLAVSLEPLGAAAGNALALRLLAGRLADGEDVTATAAARPGLPSNLQDLLRLLIRESLDLCTAAEQEALRIVAVYPEPVELTELATVLDQTETQASAVLAHLTRLGLAELAQDGTVLMSQRIRREALREVCGDEPEALIRRAIRDVLAAVERDARGPESDQLRRTYAQVRNTMWAFRQAHALRDWESVLRFRNGLHESFFRQRLWNEGIELGMLAYDAADVLDDDAEQAWCALYPLARHHFNRKDYAAARKWSERALDKFTKLGDVHGMVAAKRYLARSMRGLGFLQEARRLYDEGLSLAHGGADRQAGSGTDADLQAHLYVGLAELDELQGEYEFAQRGYRKALRILKTIGLQSGVANAEHRLGEVALAMGHHDEACEHLTQSLRLFTRHDWPDRRAAVLKSLADLEESRERYDLAQVYLWEAAEVLQLTEAWAGLAEVETRLTRTLAPDGLGKGVHEIILGLGAGDYARLPGAARLLADRGGLPQLFTPLRCPMEGCPERRRAYGNWKDYWPDCPRHHQQMVSAAIGQAG